jgi:alpha-D-ribose 1-methylphosphonate 5-triphosphate synthase subunit PhnL
MMLTVDTLAKRFHSHILDKDIPGFDRVSFRVAAGTALGLSGPSGAGKSSVLKCIYRTYIASAGTITYASSAFGRVDLTCLPEKDVLTLRRRELAHVTQFLSVVPRVPALDVVAEPLTAAGMPAADARARARDLLNRLHIDPALHDAFPCTFSGGEKQRINLARAVSGPARLMLLDEPTASLDPASLSIALDILTEMKAAGTALVAVFHDRSVMDRLVDEVYHMPAREYDT